MAIEKSAAGYIYILNTPLDEFTIKIGKTKRKPSERSSEISKRKPNIFGFHVLRCYPVPDMIIAERVLHYVFREFAVGNEGFIYPEKKAIKIIEKVLPVIFAASSIKLSGSLQKTINKKLGAVRRAKYPKYSIPKSVLSKWEKVSNSYSKKFLRDVISLCLTEGRNGSPGYKRFMHVRGKKQIDFGRINLYLQKSHIRIEIETSQRNREKAKKAVKKAFSNLKHGNIRITHFEKALYFNIVNDEQFRLFRKWVDLGNVMPSK
jgi:hypothetical protein